MFHHINITLRVKKLHTKVLLRQYALAEINGLSYLHFLFIGTLHRMCFACQQPQQTDRDDGIMTSLLPVWCTD